MLAVCLLAPGFPPAAADPAGNWLEVLMQRLAQIPARSANFTEEKQVVALTRPLLSHGRLFYVRPKWLEKITDAPQPETLLVNGDRLSLTIGGGAPKILSLASVPAVAGLVDGVCATLAGDLPWLRRFYRIVAAGNMSHWRLELSPAGPPLTGLLRTVTIEGAGIDIKTIAVKQVNGDREVMTISPAQ
ncbi:MAG: LolA-related protein [Acetobacteraceae bacterium]